MKKQIALGAVLALGLPGIAAASDQPTAKQNASQACKAERTKVGSEAFEATYKSFGKCVSVRAKEAKAETKSAKSDCKTERKADRAAYRAKYGSNGIGACVKKTVKAEMKQETEDRAAASDACETEKSADEKAFAEKYGTNANKRNAFGKCVSKQAKAQDDQDETESGDDAPKPETGEDAPKA